MRTGISKAAGCVLAMLAAPAAVWAAAYIWTGAGGDGQWINAANWSPSSGYPVTTSDSATFTNRLPVAVAITNDLTTGTLYANHFGVTNVFDIAAGRTFSPNYYQAVDLTMTNAVVIRGGTFKPRISVCVTRKTSASGVVHPRATLTLTNTVFDLAGLTDGLYVGLDGHSTGSAIGTLDARHAEFRHGTSMRTLTAPKLSIGQRTTGIDAGLLLLPPSITNINVQNLSFQGTPDTASWIDLGDQPQLAELRVGASVTIAKGNFRYRDAGGNLCTNLPPATRVVIGAPASRAVFSFGVMYKTTLEWRWGAFPRFEGWFSEVNIGRSQNSGTAFAELDLASTDELAGDFTADNVDTPILRLGGGPRDGTGVLKVPGSVTNLAFGTFYLGSVPDLSGPPSSVFHLGSNTQLRTVLVRDDFRIGRGEFRYTDHDGTERTGLPDGIQFRVGSPANRAVLRVGDFHQLGSVVELGPGLASFGGWLSELWIGKPSAGWANHNTRATLDLRDVQVDRLDVEGRVTLGMGMNDQSECLLASSDMRCSDLFVGCDGNATLQYNKVSTLSLSNAVAVVTNQAVIQQTGLVSATIDGRSAGLDLATTNLVLAPPFVTFPQFYGHMDLVFAGDPPHLVDDYFGLRLAGDATEALTALHDAEPSRLTWNVDGLSPSYQARFGIHYDPARDVTVVGLLRQPQGTVLMLR
ncbi:MAG: hypothetical protein GX590_08870 [Lentisphaerae bacterium]|nr:hypothetical protein [Lentisphaerota bacterium]